MFRSSRLLVSLIALVAVFGAAVEAGAVTWHNTGDTAFTATGNGYLVGPNSTTVIMGCNGSDTTATVAAAPATGTTWAAMHLQTTVTGCRFSPISLVAMSCTSTFTAVQQDGLDVTGALASTCVMTASPTNVVCHFHGQRPATYHDATFPPTGYGYLTVPASNTLKATSGTAACPFGNGTTVPFPHERWSLTTASGATLPAGHTGPIITRTA